jgi:hypothetical protein
MSLRNLVGVSLDEIAPARQTLRRLLDGAARHIADAKIKAVSAETRFAAAYTAIRMLADARLHAHGYRTLTSRAGHHQTAIQTLTLTFGVSAATVARLDTLRRQRNLVEYTGDAIAESAVAECLAQAEALLDRARTWLKANRPELGP